MKRTAVLAFFLMAALSSFAGESDIFRIGAKFGPNLFFGSGSADDTDYEGSRVTLGFTAGAAARSHNH